MNAPALDTNDLLVLMAHHEAIRAAQKTHQIGQFKHAHQAAGRWARDQGMQGHALWLEDGDTDTPYGMNQPGLSSFVPGIAWLLSQGWKPGEDAAAKLLTNAVLEISTDGRAQETAPGPDEEFDDLLSHCQHHDATAQGRILGQVLQNIEQYNVMWNFPRVHALVAWVSDDAIIAMEEPHASPKIRRLVDERKAAAQAGRLHASTPGAAGTARAPRM